MDKTIALYMRLSDEDDNSAVKFDFVYADSVFPVELRFRKGYRRSR